VKSKFLISNILLFFLFSSLSFADITFKDFTDKKVSYLNFFLLKFENKLVRRSSLLQSQVFATRVQYSSISVDIDFKEKEEKIFINFYTVMDKRRYSKKRYKQKISDCNQVRNIIFYRKHGYKFFTQKRDPYLSEDKMKDIFKSVFLNNLDLNDKEMDFLLNNIFVKVTIYHPINKTELICSGKANDYELK